MKQNINIEAEGNELVLKNKAGDYVIIPKKYRTEVQDMIKEGCHCCIDNLVETLPVMEDYAEDGSLLPDWDKVESVLNPKNWGVKDYTDKGSRGAAYAAARQAGEKEFMWNNKRYNTNYKGTPEQQLKETGITDEQLQNQNFVKKRLSNNLYPYSYENKVSRVFDAVVLNKKDSNRVSMDNNITKRTNPLPFGALFGKIDKSTDERRMDAFNLYVGKPQSNNTFEISKYKPSSSKDNNTEYYKIKDEEFTNNIINNLQGYKDVIDYVSNLGIDDTEIEDLQEKMKWLKADNFTVTGLRRTRKTNAHHNRLYNELTYLFSEDDTAGEISTNLKKINNYNTKTKGVSTLGESDIMGNFSVSFGKDNKGEYVSYYDKWDLEPVDFGKPFEIYDRVYYRDNPNYNQEVLKKLNKKLEYAESLKTEYDSHGNFIYKDINNNIVTLPNNMEYLVDYQNKLKDEIKQFPKRYIKQYYSDKELSELDIDKKNFDTLALQRELSNRGYKLPKSTKEDGTLDGILGDETKNALLEYRKSQNKTKQK